MKIRKQIFLIGILGFLSFATSDKNLKEFNYPKIKDAVITLSVDKIDKFREEWRGSDYYYYGESKDGFIVSVLFYKLNEAEIQHLVDDPRLTSNTSEISPFYPMSYFTTHSNTRQYESNQQIWGDSKDDFMYSQFDIKEMQGQVVNQKSMYAYTMFGKDIFVNIHLSKILCSKEDSTVMRQILDSVKKKK
jgi:hypothetical protein